MKSKEEGVEVGNGEPTERSMSERKRWRGSSRGRCGEGSRHNYLTKIVKVNQSLN